MQRTAGILALFVALAAPQSTPAAEVPVADLVPAGWRHSIHHDVDSHASLDGDHLVFGLDSATGHREVRSLALLGIRVHEARTMAEAAAQFEREQQDIGAAIAGQRGVGSDSVLDLLTQPLQTAVQLADNLGSNLESTLEGDYLEKLPGSDTVDGITGDPQLAPFKRSVAAQLNLDVYSSNAAVQAFLDRLATLRAAGKLRQVIATVGTDGDGGPLRPRDVETAQFEALIKNNEAGELARLQRRSLTAVGIEAELVDAFLRHPHYSPRHRTYITGYLELLRAVDRRGELLRSALTADTEADALAHQTLARLAVEVHRGGTRLAAFTAGGVVPTAVSTDGNVLYFIPVDYVMWGEASAATVQALIEDGGDTAPFIVIAGRFSDTARAALADQGIPVREGFRYRPD